jgi:hypothetical protein
MAYQIHTGCWHLQTAFILIVRRCSEVSLVPGSQSRVWTPLEIEGRGRSSSWMGGATGGLHEADGVYGDLDRQQQW